MPNIPPIRFAGTREILYQLGKGIDCSQWAIAALEEEKQPQSRYYHGMMIGYLDSAMNDEDFDRFIGNYDRYANDRPMSQSRTLAELAKDSRPNISDKFIPLLPQKAFSLLAEYMLAVASVNRVDKESLRAFLRQIKPRLPQGVDDKEFAGKYQSLVALA